MKQIGPRDVVETSRARASKKSMRRMSGERAAARAAADKGPAGARNEATAWARCHEGATAGANETHLCLGPAKEALAPG